MIKINKLSCLSWQLSCLIYMRKILISLLILITNYGFAQNLILNPSFEDTVCTWPIPGNPCWDYHAAVESSCVNWYAPAGSIPDYFHVNYNSIDSLWDRIDSHGNPGNGVPNNFFGNNIYPRTGRSEEHTSELQSQPWT